MNLQDDFYEEEKVLPEQREYHVHFRTVREIFNHIREKMDERNRKLKEDIFSANVRRTDAEVWTEAYRIQIGELL